MITITVVNEKSFSLGHSEFLSIWQKFSSLGLDGVEVAVQ